MTLNFQLRHLVMLLSLLMALPAFVVLGSWLLPQWDSWAHLADTVLAGYIQNSLVLAFGVGITSGALGTWCAWCVSQYQFPLVNHVRWMLFLPLAIPPYIMGYLYTGVLDFSGPIQRQLRDITGLSYGEYWFPDVQSMPGAIFVLSLVLFPYVYGLAYVAFTSQSRSLLQVAQNHGLNGWQYFIKVSLPLALPAILTGILLTMMESLADFGTVEYLGIATFTTGIFRTWFGMNQPLVAAQLSAGLVCFVLFLFWLEKRVRERQRFYQNNQQNERLSRQISKTNALLVLSSLLLIMTLSFFVPLLRLVSWSWLVFKQSTEFGELLALVTNSVLVAGFAAVVIMAIALLFGYALRNKPNKLLSFVSSIAVTGYAFPGAVIAVGTVIVLGKADLMLNEFLGSVFNWQPGLVFSGTLVALLFAYSIRYLTVGFQHVNNGLNRISPSFDQAGKTLGESDYGVLRKIHFPILKSSLLVGGLMVFVDVLKELPATLILRPFNFDTLAVKTYELASDERLTDASLPALLIVMAGILPVWVIQRNIKSH
ncbi:ABC transporter permease [Planctobacterium marinum]|uniref:Iron(III) ABC transporter permease n=1 Tax=Planctobacterium marinum TaxID=1631968 RepID=A0AA48HPE1_9ALTE|nr:iron(III) ABC transporter permease [Planctobacterium marinum]